MFTKSRGIKSFSFLLIAVMLLTASACVQDSEDWVADPPEILVEEPEAPVVDEATDEEDPDELVPERPILAPDYYWPFLNLGSLFLSDGDFVVAPDIIESEPGFIDEFVAGHSYRGQVFWLVKEADIFAVEGAKLVFDVEYYEGNEWAYELNFILEIEGLAPEPGDEGVQEFVVDLEEQQENFVVTVHRVILGKEQPGKISSDPISYIALDLEMQALETP